MNNTVFEAVDQYISNLLSYEDEALKAATNSTQTGQYIPGTGCDPYNAFRPAGGLLRPCPNQFVALSLIFTS